MAKIAVTPTIVLAEFILFRKTVSFQKVSSGNHLSPGFRRKPKMEGGRRLRRWWR